MPAERNDGSRLERLVEMIEGLHLPDGFSIRKNSPVYNDEGQQIAELDIFISGRIGSVTHCTLFECRDRPSQGAAPVGWIEQLFGRKQRLKLSSIVAVSTTGFAPGAVEFAAQENIPLRTVEALTESEIRGFLPSAPLYETEGNFTAVSLSVVPEDTSQEAIKDPTLTREVSRFKYDNKAKVFLNLETNTLLSMRDLWADVLHNHYAEAFSDVLPDWQFVSKTIETRHTYRAQFLMIHNGIRNRIQTLTYTADVRHRLAPMQLVDAVSYSGNDNPTSLVARWIGGKDNAVEIGVVMNKPNEINK